MISGKHLQECLLKAASSTWKIPNAEESGRIGGQREEVEQRGAALPEVPPELISYWFFLTCLPEAYLGFRFLP